MPVAVLRLVWWLGWVALMACGAHGANNGAAAERGRCKDVELDVERTWSSATKSRITTALGSLGRDVAQETVERVETKLSALERTWVLRRQTVCTDLMEGRLRQEAYVRITVCIDNAAFKVQALASVLGTASNDAKPNSDKVHEAEKVLEETQKKLDSCTSDSVNIAYGQGADDKLSKEAQITLAQAEVYYGLNDFETAGRAAGQVVQTLEATPNKSLLVDALNLQAQAEYGLGRSASAVGVAQRSIELAKTARYPAGEAEAYDVLGASLQRAGRDQEALEAFRAALALSDALPKETREQWAAQIEVQVGQCLRSMDRYDEALSTFQHALGTQRRTQGARHPGVARTLDEIGTTYLQQKDSDQALLWLKQAFDMEMATLGPYHTQTATTAGRMGLALQAKKQYEQALSLLQNAFEVFFTVLGGNHPSTATFAMVLGSAYVDQSDFDRALPLLQGAYEALATSDGPDQDAALQAMAEISRTLDFQHKYPDALMCAQRVYDARSRDHSAAPAELADALRDLGSINEDMNDFPKALEWYERARKVLEEGQGVDAVESVAMRASIGVVRCKAQPSGDGLRMLTQNVAALERTQSADDYGADIARMLADCSAARGYHAAALEGYRKAAQLAAADNPKHPFVGEMKYQVQRLCDAGYRPACS